MADIDMIPRSWREAERVRRALRRTGAALACVAVLGIGAVGGVRWRATALERRAAALDAAANQAQDARARETALQASSMRLLRADATLQALRRAGELDALARALDAALGGQPNGQVWLTGLSLQRDAQGASPKDGAPGPAVEELASADGGAPAWRLASTIQISGQASDYGAVTAFLAALGRQDGIANLRLVASGAGAGAQAGDFQAIDFQATAYLVRPKTP